MLVVGRHWPRGRLPADESGDLVVNADREAADNAREAAERRGDAEPREVPPPMAEPAPERPDAEAPDSVEDAAPVQGETLEGLPGAEGVLYALTPNAVARVDLATGEHVQRELRRVSGQSGPGHLTVTGDHLVLSRYGHPVFVLPRDLDGEARELAEPVLGNAFIDSVHVGPGAGAVTFVTRQADSTRLHSVDAEDGTSLAVEELPLPAQVLHLTGQTAVIGLSGESSATTSTPARASVSLWARRSPPTTSVWSTCAAGRISAARC